MATIEATLQAAEELGIRLEVVGGLTVWEGQPVVKHQRASFRIQQSIRSAPGTETGCACVHYADIAVRFADGSQKRPDIAVFYREPDEEESEVTLRPEAVIEIISKGYEAKDLEVGVPFYLRMGVPDVIVFDPYANTVQHHRRDQPVQNLASPAEIVFACGCRCTV